MLPVRAVNLVLIDISIKCHPLALTPSDKKIPTGVGTGQWAVASEQVIQAGKIWREDNRMSTGRVKG